ncbi:Endoribonuclease L-PSP/chorismate mutase-like protein [Boeremia exigua]|uniref:Endoribonuclease L-PSP/chorismate mutase-like protein n=1 Tax=Boeremia exigua TaxID=749465 RepID=UPI001E8CA1AE|nr:Endoribonuclease L-PSP/chorismate mutase-like protein [Boeremia exigua]KAH6612177.1 Endoribonuclease L-PSP/chorismate mutase-like protein [Boeremia exigua]
MSSLSYNNPAGAAQKHSELGHYSQSVDLGNGTIKCSGQGGWDPESGALDANDTIKQIRLAMENVDIVLKAAGLRGWEDVYLLRSYHCDIRTSWEPTVEALKTRIPGHRPVWTAVAVPHLAFPAMLIELEVEAKRQD